MVLFFYAVVFNFKICEKKNSIEVELSQLNLSENRVFFFQKKKTSFVKAFFAAVHEPSELGGSKSEERY